MSDLKSTTERVMHTPGPWNTSGITNPNTDPRMSVWGPTPIGSQSEWIARDIKVANARLIAAAPTMYQELELAADTFRDFSNVLNAIGKDTMAAAASIAERHIREQLAAIAAIDALERAK